MREVSKILKGSKLVHRYENNPILTYKDVPYPAHLVFNAGVSKYHDEYIMVFRDDFFFIDPNGERKLDTCCGVAKSDDGIHWTVRKEPLQFNVVDEKKEIERFYDPRIIVIEDELYMCFAVDTHHGVCGGIGKVRGDFEALDVISISVPDNRNMVLFPEKINGMFVRLERPFPMYGHGPFDIWMSKSPDLKFWGESSLVMGTEEVEFANNKIGPGAPPIKTDAGWLCLFHTVDVDDTRGKNGWEDFWKKRYCIGLMLLDLNDPSKVIGKYSEPLMAPEAPYEIDGGFRNDVLFPGGMILEDNGEVKIYYGAADAYECLATANINDLIALCK